MTGDGEPDRDFPALGSEKLLSDFNLDEYCICVVEGRRARSGTTSARGGGATANNNNTGNTMTDNSMSTFSPAVPSSGMSGLRQSPSLGLLSSAGGGGGGSTTGRARDDTGDTLGERTHRDRDRTRTSSKQSEDSFQNSAIVSLGSNYL